MSAGFLNAFSGVEDPETKLWTVREPLHYQTEGGSIYTVPAGFPTNFASIPRVFWNIVAPTDCVREAVLHDYLYWLRGGAPYRVVREQADMRFLVSLRARGDLPEWKCLAMWRAVRWFGWYGWSKKPEPIKFAEDPK